MANSGRGVKISSYWIRNLGTLRSQVLKQIVIGMGVCAGYILAAKLSLLLASVHPSATPVWPPTGIAIAALVACGLRFWPAIFMGAFVVNVTTAGSVLTSAGIATGNTLEALLASLLVLRFANGKHAFDRTWDILRFALYCAVLSTAVADTFGVTSLTLGGFAPWNQYGLIWRTWWLGDAAGALIFTPFLLRWTSKARWHWSGRQLLELSVLFSGTLLTAPTLLRAAFRYDPRQAPAVICLLGMLGVVNTVPSYGPSIPATANGPA